MKLELKEILNDEIIHFASPTTLITSHFNIIKIQEDGKENIVKMPINIKQKIGGITRLTRRALRLDKSCVLPTFNGYVVFWQGSVYHIKKNENIPLLTLNLTGCRNPMHNAIANINGKELYFGEYGNPHPSGKTIYRSIDGGVSWDKVYNISCDKIRHIHCCKWDPYEEKIWVFTGDFEGQSYILCADKNFENVEWIGDGNQYYRACNAFFKKDTVHWIMDSPLSEVHHIKLNRNTRKIELMQSFAGPVWYSKELSDGYYMAVTAQEIGPSHKDKKLHFMVSSDLKHWEEVRCFEHDKLPKGYMKYGVVAFADGGQDSQRFYTFYEGVKGLDGKSCLCTLSV